MWSIFLKILGWAGGYAKSEYLTPKNIAIAILVITAVVQHWHLDSVTKDYDELLAEYTQNAKDYARKSANFQEQQKEIEVRYIDRIKYVDQFKEVEDESKCDAAVRLFRSFEY